MNTSTEIIQKITSKPDWKSKILSDEISEKWIRELCEIGYDHNFAFNIIDIIKKYVAIDCNKINLDFYNWFLRTDFVISEVIREVVDNIAGSCTCCCKCNCLICQGLEYKLDQEYEPESDEDDDQTTNPNITPHENCPCMLNAKASKNIFASTYINQLTNLIDPDLKSEFVKLADQLPKNDFHPNSNNQMIDLFHPSMYPFIKGLTDIKLSPELVENLDMFFQWLPSEVSVEYLDDETQTKSNKISSKITSYINNLTDPNLIKPIEEIFSRFVPHFNNLLNTLYENNFIETQTILSECQVIIKAQEILLDPSKPTFNEGSWHLEGTKSEHIIATGIYYYEMNNITDNYLNFRVKVSDPERIYYPQNCPRYVSTHYGFDSKSYTDSDSISDTTDSTDSYEKIPCISLEPVQTYENLCLVFPNTFQHKVSKISLIDPTKNGSRKILVFFLIDPNHRIISTADIEPQQTFISEADAKIYRDILMFERKYESNIQKSIFEREWSLCEH